MVWEEFMTDKHTYVFSVLYYRTKITAKITYITIISSWGTNRFFQFIYPAKIEVKEEFEIKSVANGLREISTS